MRFDQIGPFVFLDKFRDDWIVSRQAAPLFLVALLFVLAVTPFLFGLVDLTNPNIGMKLGYGIVGVVGPVALFFLWFGMWRFWMRLDRSRARSKRVWFAILLIGFWYGSILYYFFV